MTRTLAMFLLFATAAPMAFVVGGSVGWFTAGAAVMLACVIGVDA